MRCHHCGKLTDVRTAGRGEEFLYRCRHCRGYHKFTSVGHHGSGAITEKNRYIATASRLIQTARVDLRSHYQNIFIHPASDELVGY